MQFVQEFEPLDLTLQEKIRNHLKNDPAPFEPSMVYEADKDQKTVKPEKRLSQFKLLTDKALFDLCDQLVAKINEQQTDLKFTVYKNDVTYIKYDQGGYFKPHEDYLSLTSNVVEEYTLIMCIDSEPDTVGGETILHFNPKFSHQSKATVTPDHCLLFRKDLRHEGAKLEKGTKEIMTLNLWCTRKTTEPLLVVTFPKTNQTHVIRKSRVMAMENMLKHSIDFIDQSENSNDLITSWQCDQFSPDEFSIVVDILNGHHISYDRYLQYERVIDYFAFQDQNLLISQIEQVIARDAFVSPDQLSTDFDYHNPKDPKAEYLLFGSEERYRQFLALVKKFRLNYMPFKIMFAEGHATFGGDFSVGHEEETIPMVPIWCTFSEKDNLMMAVNLCRLGYEEFVESAYELPAPNDVDFASVLKGPDGSIDRFQKLKNDEQFILFQGDYEDEDYDDDDDDEDDDEDDNEDDENESCSNSTEQKKKKPVRVWLDNHGWRSMGDIIHLDLAGYSSNQTIDEILEYVLCSKYDEMEHQPFLKCGQKTGNQIRYQTDYYLIDQQGQLALNPEHFQAIFQRMCDLDLYRTVQQDLQSGKIPFKFPQKAGYTENDFCNEQVYGNFNCLMVYGFIAMK